MDFVVVDAPSQGHFIFFWTFCDCLMVLYGFSTVFDVFSWGSSPASNVVR